MTSKRRAFLGQVARCTVAGIALPQVMMSAAQAQGADRVTRFGDWKLFTGVPQHENFATFHQTQAVRTMAPSTMPTVWPQGEPITLPEQFVNEKGQTQSLADFLLETDTAALLVLRDGKIVYENYALTGGPDVPWMSMSVAKSFVSSLVGAALDDGAIASLEDPIDRYSPVFKGSAYDGVRIKDVLQMSSGARWNEDYSNPESDALRLGRALSPGGSLDEFLSRTVNEVQPGTVCRYNSADTQALGVLVAEATQRPLAEYMQERLVEPLGMAQPSHWIVDEQGREMAFAGLLMTARDYARLGEMYRQEGVFNGRQVLPAAYVRAATTWDAEHLKPGRVAIGQGTSAPGYGYQWWLPAGSTEGEYNAAGVYNQFIYVNPTRDVVIVKLSANRRFGTRPDGEGNHGVSNVLALRTIAQAIA